MLKVNKIQGQHAKKKKVSLISLLCSHTFIGNSIFFFYTIQIIPGLDTLF